jgi:molybdate transport system substrate-binding protein
VRRHVRLPALLLAGVLVLTACGGDEDKASPATSAAATTGPSTRAGGTAAAAPAVQGDLTVFAAASLTDAFTEIGAAFEAANPAATVTFSFAGSSALVQQVNEGAPADVFASADEANMQKLTDAGNAAAAPTPFATNTMEIAVAAGNPEGITGLADLADPDVALVVCAPEVPCGRLAGEILAKNAVAATPKSLEENVRAVLTKVELGEADAGLVFATDVAVAGDRVTGVPIPPDENAVTTLVIAPTKESRNGGSASAFVAFVAGPDGQAILEKYGFGTP